MLKFKCATVVAAALLGIAQAGGAQAKSDVAAKPVKGDMQWFVGVGPSKPLGDLDSRSDLGFNVLGGVEFTAAPGWGVRGEASFQTFGGKGTGYGTTTEFGALVSGVYHPTITALPPTWRPYALAGIGFYSGNFSTAGVGTSATGFGFGLGGGTEWLVGGFDLFAEIRYISVSQSGGTFGWVPLTVGIRF